MKGCFVGSGSEGLQQVEVCNCILELIGKEPFACNILYIGTATYDLPGPKDNQTRRFIEAGCRVIEIRCSNTNEFSEYADMEEKCNIADAIIVSGGNTLYAIDAWHKVGLVSHLKSAADRGAVLTGGSAGAICWFDGGHSDSDDPDSYKQNMLKAAEATLVGNTPKDEASEAPEDAAAIKPWKYIRVPCLGFFHGLVCPHGDKVQSNGVLRAADFDEMMCRHSGEQGICIDHFAALVVNGDNYYVLSIPNKPGSVQTLPSENKCIFSTTREGVPGIWKKSVVSVDGVLQVVTTLVPSNGKVNELLKTATELVEDPGIIACRLANPLC